MYFPWIGYAALTDPISSIQFVDIRANVNSEAMCLVNSSAASSRKC